MAGISVSLMHGGYSKMPGDAYRLSCPKTGIRMVVTQHGGRLLSLQVPVADGAQQRKELLYSNPNLFAALPDVVTRDRSAVTWDDVLIGGEKTWAASQVKWGGVPYLDLDLGRYDIRVMDNGVHLESPVCRETGLRVIREVTLESGTGKFHIAAWLVNSEGKADNVAPWSIMQLVKPAVTTVSALACPPRAFATEGNGRIPEGIITQEENSAFYTLDLRKPHAEMFKAGFHLAGSFGGFRTHFKAGAGQIRLNESFSSLGENGIFMFPHMGRSELFSHNTLPYFETEVLGRQQLLKTGEQSDVLGLDFMVEYVENIG